MEKRRMKSLDKEISLLGFGAMRMPLIEGTDGEIDIKQVEKMIDLAVEAGVNYFDTAYPYHGGKSEGVLRETLVKRYDRDSFFLASKLPVWECEEYADYERIFNIQLERAGVEYFDFYLLHALDASRHRKQEKIGMYKFAQELKASGRAKHIGFSFHDKPEVFKEILSGHPEMEFAQLQINYLDWEPLGSDECYRFAQEMGKPVIIMEPVKGGTLAAFPKAITGLLKDADPDASVASWAMRYAGSFDNVMTVLSGMSNIEQMEDNIRTMTNFRKLTDGDRNLIAKVVEEFNKVPVVPCTNCQYCKDCPQEIDIPLIFRIYNEYLRSEDLQTALQKYGKIDGENRADKCIGCGACVDQCPQNIQIPEEFEKIVPVFS